MIVRPPPEQNDHLNIWYALKIKKLKNKTTLTVGKSSGAQQIKLRSIEEKNFIDSGLPIIIKVKLIS